MKMELELVRRSSQPLPIDLGIDRLRIPTQQSRREVREASDFVIHDALRKDDVPAMAIGVCGLMLAVAGVIDRYDIEPDVPDLVQAVEALIEDGRSVVDRGLALGSWDTVKCGAVMLEITARGICATLSFPYDELMLAIHQGRDIVPILKEAGHLKDKPEKDA